MEPVHSWRRVSPDVFTMTGAARRTAVPAAGASERDNASFAEAGRRVSTATTIDRGFPVRQREQCQLIYDAGREPAVDLDGALSDERDHGVGAAEGDDGGTGEEQALLREQAADVSEQDGVKPPAAPTSRGRSGG
jgi:hypothetical protein